MNEPHSRYNINISRVTYLYGDKQQIESLTKILGGYYFLQFKPLAEGERPSQHQEAFFFVAAVNFTNNAELQTLASLLESIQSPLAHPVIYVYAPATVSRDQLLFAQEIGAKFIASGVRKNDDIRDYLKRYCLEISTVGSLANYEKELEAACQANDRGSILRLVEKLKTLDDSGEQALVILAGAYNYLKDWKRAEVSLKRILQVNPQNLWAANALGRLLLKSKRGSQGIEILSKLSHFHDLNGERLLALGDAYAKAGMAQQAEEAYIKGDKLNNGKDMRFKDGLIKARIIDRDYQGSKSLLAGRNLSSDVIAFLNLRAIMASREGHHDEAIEYYQYAVSGAGEVVTKAKLKFNLGLACIRMGDLATGQLCLKESLSIGGKQFSRARGPLEIVEAILKSKSAKSKQDHKNEMAQIDSEMEWETLR